MARDPSPGPAWWDEAGPDVCEFCQHAFHVEVGFYCADCDRPVCPVCVITLSSRAACPECDCGSEDP